MEAASRRNTRSEDFAGRRVLSCFSGGYGRRDCAIWRRVWHLCAVWTAGVV